MVRIDVSWAMLQPDGPTSYSICDVGFVDRVIGMATARGLEPLVTLWTTPAWADGGKGERALPDDPQRYADVARWAAARWAGQVRAWEVWNEPNSDHFMRGADPAAYVRLLRAAYPAFMAGDPTAVVVFGRPSFDDDAWIAKAYAAGARGAFDAMATHRYMGMGDEAPELPDDGTIWRLRHVGAVKRVMEAYGDGAKPIWFTELDRSTNANWDGIEPWNRAVTEEQPRASAARPECGAG